MLYVLFFHALHRDTCIDVLFTWQENEGFLHLTSCLSFRASSATAPRSINLPNFPAINNDVQCGHGAGIWFSSLYVYVYRRKSRVHDSSITITYFIGYYSTWFMWTSENKLHSLAFDGITMRPPALFVCALLPLCQCAFTVRCAGMLVFYLCVWRCQYEWHTASSWLCVTICLLANHLEVLLLLFGVWPPPGAILC